MSPENSLFQEHSGTQIKKKKYHSTFVTIDLECDNASKSSYQSSGENFSHFLKSVTNYSVRLHASCPFKNSCEERKTIPADLWSGEQQNVTRARYSMSLLSPLSTVPTKRTKLVTAFLDPDLHCGTHFLVWWLIAWGRKRLTCSEEAVSFSVPRAAVGSGMRLKKTSSEDINSLYDWPAM